MSVARSRVLSPLYEIPMAITQKGLVIGGGLAGLTAALALAEQGYATTLVEKSRDLGGNARTLYYTETDARPAAYVRELIAQVTDHPLITVHTEAEVVAFSGVVGNFNCRVRDADGTSDVSCGAVIVATGGREYTPEGWLYGEDDRVVTQKELEQKLFDRDAAVCKARTVVMIQCVGSRDEQRPYCSRVCCTAAMKNSLQIKKINPDADVYVLYRDIRTFAFKELAYKAAREAGVNFIRYTPEQPPAVTREGGRLALEVFDCSLRMTIDLAADLLALSSAILPHPDSGRVARLFKLPSDQDGFFMESHLKLKPLEFSVAGIFLCGLAHGPKFADESIAQAKGAVSRACTVLSKAHRDVGGRGGQRRQLKVRHVPDLRADLSLWRSPARRQRRRHLHRPGGVSGVRQLCVGLSAQCHHRIAPYQRAVSGQNRGPFLETRMRFSGEHRQPSGNVDSAGSAGQPGNRFSGWLRGGFPGRKNGTLSTENCRVALHLLYLYGRRYGGGPNGSSIRIPSGLSSICAPAKSKFCIC